MAAMRVDREMRREGERPLIEPLGAQRFVAKWLIAVPMGVRGGRKKQSILQSSKINASTTARNRPAGRRRQSTAA